MAARADIRLLILRNTAQERRLGQRAGRKSAVLVSDMCASVYTPFPLESVRHTGGSGGGVACGWVAVNPRSAPGLLRACFLSDSRAFSLSRPDRVLDLDWGGGGGAGVAISCLSFWSSESRKASLAE